MSDTVPSIDRAWELAELAYERDEMTVLGWADDAVMDVDSALNFTVWPDPGRSHEDQVLIIAIRVPHPDEMSLRKVVVGCDCAGDHRCDRFGCPVGNPGRPE